MTEPSKEQPTTWAERMRAIADAEQRQREAIVAEPAPVVTIMRARDVELEPLRESVRPIAAPVPPVAAHAPEPPVETSIEEHIEIILDHLRAGRVADAKSGWRIAEPLPARTAILWKQKMLVGELVGIATSLQPDLLTLLVYAVRCGEVPEEELREYACERPDRAFIESVIIKKSAPHIGIQIGDALLYGKAAELTEQEAEEREPSKLASAVWMGLCIVMMCGVVAILIVITRPRHGDESAVRSMAAEPEVREPLILEEPTPVHAGDPRDLSAVAIEQSLYVLSHNHWMESRRSLDGLFEAVMHGDCATATETASSIELDREAPELAERHLGAIRERIAQLCSEKKPLPWNSR